MMSLGNNTGFVRDEERPNPKAMGTRKLTLMGFFSFLKEVVY